MSLRSVRWLAWSITRRLLGTVHCRPFLPCRVCVVDAKCVRIRFPLLPCGLVVAIACAKGALQHTTECRCHTALVDVSRTSGQVRREWNAVQVPCRTLWCSANKLGSKPWDGTVLDGTTQRASARCFGSRWQHRARLARRSVMCVDARGVESLVACRFG